VTDRPKEVTGERDRSEADLSLSDSMAWQVFERSIDDDRRDHA
jgi:hypothetical protein